MDITECDFEKDLTTVPTTAITQTFTNHTESDPIEFKMFSTDALISQSSLAREEIDTLPTGVTRKYSHKPREIPMTPMSMESAPRSYTDDHLCLIGEFLEICVFSALLQ